MIKREQLPYAESIANVVFSCVLSLVFVGLGGLLDTQSWFAWLLVYAARGARVGGWWMGGWLGGWVGGGLGGWAVAGGGCEGGCGWVASGGLVGGVGAREGWAW